MLANIDNDKMKKSFLLKNDHKQRKVNRSYLFFHYFRITELPALIL